MRQTLVTGALALALSTVCSAALAQAAAQQTSPGPVAPEDQATGLEDIIVTATRRSENLQDVPVAVSAISSATLTKQGVFETSDLNHSIPNLQVSSPYGKEQPNFSVRGVGVGTEFNANAASPVGVYVDEVYQTFRSSHGQQLFDLDQIEVVRGPQGTLYGRNTTGGAINFITRAPDLSGTEGYGTIGYGTFNRVNAEGAVEFTPVEDTFGVRLAGTYVNADPYIHNRLPAGPGTFTAGGASGLNQNSGRDPGGYESYALRLTARWKPTDRVDLSLKAYAGHSEGGTEVPLATGQSRTSDVIDYTSPNFLLGGIFAAFAPSGLLPSSYSASARGLSDREIEADTVGIATTESQGIVFNAKIQLTDNLRLISVTDYDDGKYEQSTTDCDATPLRLCNLSYGSDFHAFNQDVRLDYSNGPVKLIVGAYYGKDSITTENKQDFFNFLRDVNAAVGSPSGYFNPGGAFNGAGLSAGSLPTGINGIQHFQQNRESSAVYGEGSYQLTDTIKVTAGIRYTSDDNEFVDGITTYYDDLGVARLITVSNFTQGGAFAPYFLQNVRNEAGAVVIPSFQGLGIPLPGGLEQKGSSNSVSGRAIIDWKPTESTLVYASYSRGYRAGTFNGLAYGSANQVYFVPPEEVDAYELGFKSRFIDNRLQINGAFFYYDYRGQQGQVVDNTATANLVSLDGTLTGLEIDTQFAVTDRLRVNASFGLLDTEYADGDCPATPITGFPAQIGSCVVSSSGPVSVAGNPFPYAAKSSINVGADWDVAQIGRGQLSLHADAAYTGQFYYDSFKDYSAGPLPTVTSGRFANGEGDYWTINGRISYDLDNISFAVWGKNLTDETYYPFGIALENLFGNGYRVRAEPRTYGAEATVRF